MATGRRDHNLPLTEVRRKINPAATEDALNRYVNLVQDPHVAVKYMEGGALSDLAHYAHRNTAVTGYFMNTLFSELRDTSDYHNGGDGGKRLQSVRTVFVRINTRDFETTSSTFYSNKTTIIDSEKDGKTKISSEWKGYGATFGVDIDLEFRVQYGANSGSTVKFEWKDTIIIPPRRDRVEEYTALHFKPPPAQEFDIGAVFDLFHDDKELSDAALRQMVTLTEKNDVFPRYNAAVRAIEKALKETGSFADMIVGYLARLQPFRSISSRNSSMLMPWGPARIEIAAAAEAAAAEAAEGDAAMDDAGDGGVLPYLGKALGNALDKFHDDQKKSFLPGMGSLGVLMQRLVLVKHCATHLHNCYESIDHYMLRAFMSGIGDHNWAVFEKHEPLDPLLNKVAMHKARRANIELANAEIDITGCSLDVKVKLPNQSYYSPLMGIPHVDPNFEGELSFGIGSKPIKVQGEYTRTVFVLPTESDGDASSRPQMQIQAEAEYKNTPVVVVIGTPDGKRTNVKTAFLLVDTWAMYSAIQIGAIPSNKKFAKAMCMLPPEMADFAAAIRACDISESGLDMHVIYLRPLLASALAIEEDDLMGDPDWMTQLVALMRGGASLQSIAQCKTRGPRAGAAEGFEDVGAPAYDLGLMKERTKKLLQEMWEQGKKDHYRAPPPPAAPPPQNRHMGAVYRSLGAADSPEQPRYNALGAGVGYRPLTTRHMSSGPVPMQQDLGPPGSGAAPPPPAAGGEASVESISDSLKGVGVDADDRDFMGTLLTHMEHGHDNSEGVLGAPLTIPDCATNCYFAKGKVPDNETTSDFIAPGVGSEWSIRPNLNASTKTLRRMLAAHVALGKTVPTTRLAVFGAFVEWETNLLTGLMSGSIDPTKTIFETIKHVAALQNQE